MSGLPSRIASDTAAALDTFITTQPASIGSLPEGTSRPVMTLMSCFSPPCGYLAFTRRMLAPGISRTAAAMHSAASGLLSSTATTPLLAPSMYIARRSPSAIRPDFSSIARWSPVR